jgi:hypothetical protein
MCAIIRVCAYQKYSLLDVNRTCEYVIFYCFCIINNVFTIQVSFVEGLGFCGFLDRGHPTFSKSKIINTSAYFGPSGDSRFEGYPLPSSRLGSSFSCCTPAATNPEVCAGHCAACTAACRGFHIGSLHKLPHTVCNPLFSRLVAFYDPR